MTPKATGRHAVDDGAGRDRRLADVGEDAHRIGRADRRGEIGHDRGKTDRHDRPEVAARGAEARRRHHVVHPHRAVPADDGQAKPRDDRRPCRAIDPEPQPEYQRRIENGGDDRAGQRHIHRPPRVADRAQHARQRHAQPIRTLAGMVIARKVEATCRRLAARMQERRQTPVAKGEHAAPPRRAEMIVVIVSAEAASLRPRGRSPAPSAATPSPRPRW